MIRLDRARHTVREVLEADQDYLRNGGGLALLGYHGFTSFDRRASPMMLPVGDGAYVDHTKIVDYLLSLSHPDGRNKAEFFRRFGFKAEQWQALAEALRMVGVSNPVVATIESPYGTRYTVDGPLQTPSGRSPSVRTVWILEPGSPGPRLITAYPI